MGSRREEQELWCVDVVLRAMGRDNAEERVVELVARSLGDEGDGPQPRRTYSYDAPPPDGSLGVSCWIRAASAGEAADAGLRLVKDAARAATGLDHPLWDLRLLPSSAVITRSEEPVGAVLRAVRAQTTLWDRLRWLARLASRWEVLQLRVFGTTFIAFTRRRSVLLLETVGRKTGKRRLTPVTYRVDDDGSYLIGGGAGGMTKVDWVANLRRQQSTRVWIRRREQHVHVRELEGAERDAAHDAAAARWPEVKKFEQVSGRTVPYFRLTKTTQSSRA